MSFMVRTERRRVSRLEGNAGGREANLKSALRYYLYHNNSKAFHEARSGMRIGRSEGGVAHGSGDAADGGGQAIRVEDSLVSKEHCRIWIQGNVLYVEDLGTVNATRVNSVPMQPGARRKVLLHDVIEVGNQRFILTQQDKRPPEFTEDLTSRGRAPYRARRKSDGSLTAVLSGESFPETLVALNPSQYRELRFRSAIKSAVGISASQPRFRKLFWLGVVMLSLLTFLIGGALPLLHRI